MYQKYQTEVIVLRYYDRGEADRVYALYTREFGLLWARASSVRRENSRMRYALQSYARARVSLIRGSRGWRIAGTHALEGIDVRNVRGMATFARIAGLLERLIKGEEQNGYLFETLSEAHTALKRLNDSTQKESLGAIELLCVARVLYALGYVSTEALGTALFTHTAFSEPHLEEAEAARAQLLVSVNRALSQTQL